MTYMTEAALAAMRQGSYEERIDRAVAAAMDQLQRPVAPLATHADRVVVADEAEGVWVVRLSEREGQVVAEAAAPAEGVLSDADLPAHAARQVRATVQALMDGTLDEAAMCTRVRELAGLIDAGQPCLVAEALEGIADAVAGPGAAWWRWYKPRERDVRRRVWGSVREAEAQVPDPLREATGATARTAMQALADAVRRIVDAVRPLRFDRGDILGAARESMIGEALAMAVALEQAGRLLVEDDALDVQRVAQAHDLCVVRVKHMAVVARYLAQRANNRVEA